MNGGTGITRRGRAGSHKTYAGWEPRTCVDCGRKLTLNDAAMSNLDDTTGEAWSLCSSCLLKRRTATEEVA